MDEHKLYELTYETQRRVAGLSINTNSFHGSSSLMTPPESANSCRRSSYDMNMNFNQTPISTCHPNTPVQFPDRNTYNIAPVDKMTINFPVPPSPVDYAAAQQSYAATACNSPTWHSQLPYDQKPSLDSSFYQESSSMLSTDQNWSASGMDHYSEIDFAPDPNSLFMLPSQDNTSSYMSDVDPCAQHLPAFIAPTQAVHQPEMDYSMSLAGWGVQTPVHDSNVLHSSSPPEYSPVTPFGLENSFDASYVKHETSPSASSIYVHAPRSSLNKKGRKGVKVDKRRSIRKVLHGIEITTDEVSMEYAENKKAPERRMHKCEYAGCKQEFARSEHCKRHMGSHSGVFPYACYISEHPLDPANPVDTRCRVGKKKNGCQNRRDNARSHNWTHLKAWLVAHNPLVKDLHRHMNKKSKGRNIPISPVQFLKLVRGRDMPQQQQMVLTFLNQEAGKDFKVHILWEQEGCPVVACQGRAGEVGGCGMCRPKAGSKKK